MFYDIAAQIAGNPAQLHYGVAVADFDQDGVFEIFVAGFGCPSQVLKWDGEALFDIADAELADPSRLSIGVAAGDVDGDGREEIYVLNTDTFAGPKRVGDRLFSWRNGHWVDLFCLPENRRMLNVTAGRSVACIDRCGTGRYGFVVANYGGPFRLYELDQGRLADLAPLAGIDGITGGRALTCLPILSERTDIFAVNENGANFLFRNDGSGRFEEVALDCGLADLAQHGRGVAALDANGDGRFDLAYGNWEGPHRLMVRGRDGVFRDIASEDYALPSRVRNVIAADFDNNGHEEIFFNNIGQPNRLFGWRDEEWKRIDIGAAAEPRGLGTGAAVADIDGDGILELLISHGEAGVQPLTLYKARSNDNNWLRVMPLTPAGAPARGAVVLCHAGDRQMVRAIDCGSGYLCQMEPVAHFGLGRATRADAVEVRWPDGARIRMGSVDACREIRVAHPSSTDRLRTTGT